MVRKHFGTYMANFFFADLSRYNFAGLTSLKDVDVQAVATPPSLLTGHVLHLDKLLLKTHFNRRSAIETEVFIPLIIRCCNSLPFVNGETIAAVVKQLKTDAFYSRTSRTKLTEAKFNALLNTEFLKLPYWPSSIDVLMVPPEVSAVHASASDSIPTAKSNFASFLELSVEKARADAGAVEIANLKQLLAKANENIKHLENELEKIQRKRITAQVASLSFSSGALRRQLKRKCPSNDDDDDHDDNDGEGDDGNDDDCEEENGSSEPTSEFPSPAKPLSSAIPQTFQVRTADHKFAGYSIRIRRLFWNLTTFLSLSARQAAGAYAAFLACHNIKESVPSVTAIADWNKTSVAFAKFQACRLILEDMQNLSLSSDATTVRPSKKQKISNQVFVVDNSTGSIVMPTVPTAGKSGKVIGRALADTLKDHGNVYYLVKKLCSSDDEYDVDIASKAHDFMKDVFDNFSSFTGDGGGENGTLLVFNELFKKIMCDDAVEEYSGMADAEKLQLIGEQFDKLRQSITIDRPPIVRVYCALHYISLFSEGFFKSADAWYCAAYARLFPERDAPCHNCLSHDFFSLLSGIEPRGQSVESKCHFFHALVAEKLTKYNSFSDSTRCRQWAFLHNCTPLVMFADEVKSVFENFADGDGSSRCRNALDLLNDPLASSAIRIGAIVWHYWLLPLLCETSRKNGMEGLNVQKSFLQHLTEFRQADKLRLVLSGDRTFINDIGYNVVPRHEHVYTAITFSDADITADHEDCIKRFVDLMLTQLQKKQPAIFPGNEPAAASVQHAKMQSAHCERVFSVQEHIVHTRPNQLIAITAAQVTISSQNGFAQTTICLL